MDEPLLGRTIAESMSNTTPRLNKRISTLKLIRNDSILSALATPRVPNSIPDQVINIHKSNSAPALYTEEIGLIKRYLLNSKPYHRHESTSPRIIRLALSFLLLYIMIGVATFLLTNGTFRGERTHKPIDALYFTVVTLCTVGYGDIVPASTFAKLFTCVFILVGFGFIDILLNGLLGYVLDKQEEVLLGTVDKNLFHKMVRMYIIDEKKGRMRIRIKICLALGVVVLCLAVGTVTLHYVEEFDWVDSFYLSVTSVTTVGYGDYGFKTVLGRCFAVVWILTSTLAVARAFLYLTEYRIEKRNRVKAKEVLHRKLTLGDLIAADINHDGSISKAEYVIFKLKEIGKIDEEDVLRICRQFDGLESAHSGKITVADLMGIRNVDEA